MMAILFRLILQLATGASTVNRIIVSKKWTDDEIEENRKYDRDVKKEHFKDSKNITIKSESGFFEFVKDLFRKN